MVAISIQVPAHIYFETTYLHLLFKNECIRHKKPVISHRIQLPSIFPHFITKILDVANLDFSKFENATNYVRFVYKFFHNLNQLSLSNGIIITLIGWRCILLQTSHLAPRDPDTPYVGYLKRLFSITPSLFHGI